MYFHKRAVDRRGRGRIVERWNYSAAIPMPPQLKTDAQTDLPDGSGNVGQREPPPANGSRRRCFSVYLHQKADAKPKPEAPSIMGFSFADVDTKMKEFARRAVS
jgi:hypothetical protein